MRTHFSYFMRTTEVDSEPAQPRGNYRICIISGGATEFFWDKRPGLKIGGYQGRIWSLFKGEE